MNYSYFVNLILLQLFQVYFNIESLQDLTLNVNRNQKFLVKIAFRFANEKN